MFPKAVSGPKVGPASFWLGHWAPPLKYTRWVLGKNYLGNSGDSITILSELFFQFMNRLPTRSASDLVRIRYAINIFNTLLFVFLTKAIWFTFGLDDQNKSAIKIRRKNFPIRPLPECPESPVSQISTVLNFYFP